MKLKVGKGKGNKIRFWDDCWVGESTLSDRFPLLYRMANSHNASILLNHLDQRVMKMEEEVSLGISDFSGG